MNYYTNVVNLGSKILLRGIENGRRVTRRLDYSPSLFVPTTTEDKYHSIDGVPLGKVNLGSIPEAREFIRRHKDVTNFPIYGMTRYEYAFICDEYPGDIEWDINDLLVVPLDIEVDSSNGFPEPSEASDPVTAITMRVRDTVHVFATGDYTPKSPNVEYHYCLDEKDLLQEFLALWSIDYPDIVTGWNVKFFDIPYLVNRIINLFGDATAKRLSPHKLLSERTVFIMGKEQKTFIPSGLSILDYLELYKKFTLTTKDSYKLDAICEDELGEKKLSYEEYGNLHNLFAMNFELFIDYNIRDVELIDRLEDKLKLIELAITLAYDSKSNYEDVFTQVRMWDNIIYNYLYKENIIIPPSTSHVKNEAYVGAYVKEPIIGLHNWVASFDLNSLYPHLIMQFNISPDTFIEPGDWTEEHYALRKSVTGVDELLNEEVDTSALRRLNCTMTPNRQFFSVEKQGFLSKIMEDMYNDRTVYKRKAIEARKLLELETDKDKRFEIEKQIARFNNLQMAKKVSLNSAYGALGNEFFRLFDVRQASAITTSGQLVIRWIEKRINGYLNKILKTKDRDYVIASDTDSIYVCLDELVRQLDIEKATNGERRKIIAFLDKVCEERLQPFIDSSYEDLAKYLNVYKQKMQMKREVLADRGIWLAKKRYVLNVYNSEGVEYAEPKVKIMGLEVQRSSVPKVYRSHMKECIKIIINDTESKLQEYIKKVKEETKRLPVADIAFPRGVNGLGKYADAKKSVPIHVRASLLYNRLLKQHGLLKKYETIKEGDKIRFVHLKEPNAAGSDIIAFKDTIPTEFGLDNHIDYTLQFEKAFLSPVKNITDCIGWKTERVNTLFG